MTGESDLIRKNPEKCPFLLSGCKVQTGFGKMLVVAVGMNTQFGILKQAVLTATQERDQTPLQEKLDTLAKRVYFSFLLFIFGFPSNCCIDFNSSDIGYFGMVAAAFVFILLFIFWLVVGVRHTERFKKGDFWMQLLDYLSISVTIIVMAVPEVFLFLLFLHSHISFFLFYLFSTSLNHLPTIHHLFAFL